MDTTKDRETIKFLYETAADAYEEKTIQGIRDFNKKYLDEFEAELKKIGFSDKTVSKHVTNIRFYIDEYLPKTLEYDLFTISDSFDDFFERYFVEHMLFPSVDEMKEYLTSVKRFVRFMYVKGYYSEREYALCLFMLKLGRGKWLENMAKHEGDFFGDLPK